MGSTHADRAARPSIDQDLVLLLNVTDSTPEHYDYSI